MGLSVRISLRIISLVLRNCLAQFPFQNLILKMIFEHVKLIDLGKKERFNFISGLRFF